jgi:hypothetical protein
MIALAASQCYDQNGVTTTDTACDSGSLPTFCCPSGYSCLSNGLCGKGDSLQMGSCSDQAWLGGSCVKHCRMLKLRPQDSQRLTFVKLPDLITSPRVNRGQKGTTAVGMTRAAALAKTSFDWEHSLKPAHSHSQPSRGRFHRQQMRQQQLLVQSIPLQYR